MLGKDVIKKIDTDWYQRGGFTNRNLEFNSCIVVVFFLSD